MNFKYRLPFLLYSFILFVFFIIICRLVYLSCFFKWPPLENLTYVNSPLPSERGEIYDSYGYPLIINTYRYFCKVVPDEISGLSDSFLRRMEQDIGLPSGLLDIKKNLSKKAVYVANNVSTRQKEEIQSKGYPGVYFDLKTSRFYPQHQLACHILGLCQNSLVPCAGLDLSFDHWLSGCPGEKFSAVDVYRRPIYHQSNRTIRPVDGYDLFLSIESPLQYIVSVEAEKTFEQSSPKGIHVVVVNYQTGEIYALVNLPRFDPNSFVGKDMDYLNNPVISHVFEPGSTFKLVTLTACIEEGIVSEKTPIHCENGQYPIAGRRPLKDHHPYGILSVEDVIQKSSNIGTVKMAQKLGKRRLYYWIRSFGFAQKTGIELPFESVGRLKHYRFWHKSSIGSIPMGQEIAVPPLQMVMSFCAIANDGLLVQPTVWRLLKHEDGRKKRNKVTEVRRVCCVKTARRIQNMLARVVKEGGTGRQASIEGYEIAGKTGTAQKYDQKTGTYSQQDYFSSFIGFVNHVDFPICVGVFVDSPLYSMRYGGVVAAPLFKKIVQRIIQYRQLNLEKKV